MDFAASGGPSRRTPDLDTRFNSADIVERELSADGHRTWGWIIYRCTYKNEADWTEFVTRLTFHIERTLDSYNGLDLLPTLDCQVVQDQSQLDGASPATVRTCFERWVHGACLREQGKELASFNSAQRYNYCLLVDESALRSVVDGPAPPADVLGSGFVNLVSRDTSSGVRPEFEEQYDSEEERDEDDGDMDHYVMRIRYSSLMVGWYPFFRDQSSWFTEYREPPNVLFM